MEMQQGLFFQALTERFPHPMLHAVLEASSEALAPEFRALPGRAGVTPESMWTAPRNLLLSVHPSWHEEIIERCPQDLQPTLRTILHDAQEHHLENTSPLSLFLLDYLISQWPDKNVQSIESIGETPLRWMANCSEQQLDTIAKLVAVHDSVDVVRHIVEKKILQKILLPFSPFQQRYLKALLRRPIRSATLNKELLALLRDSPDEAKERLVERGLEKLGQSLQGASPLLIWHVFHHIDRDRAQLLSEIMAHPIPESELSEIKRNIVHAYEFLKRTETT